jgi:hypothetical protein
LVGAVIGAIVGLLGGLLAIRAERQLEYQKWVRGREDDVRRDIRLAVAEVATKLAALAHAVMWFTYKTVNSAGRMSPSAFETYQKEIHELISGIVGAQIRLAALDKSLYKSVTPFISDAINLTERVNEATELLTKDSQQGLKVIIECNKIALHFIKKLPEQIGGLIGVKSDNPDHFNLKID